MDSLLANYASSDDEEQQQQQPPSQPPSSDSAPQRSELSEPSSSRSSSFFSSLPPPKSSSLFQSLPQPKQSSKPSLPTGFFENDENADVEEGDSLSASKLGAASIKPSSLFSSLPRPTGNPTSSSSSLSSSRVDGDDDGNVTKSVSMFSSLPQPNSLMLQKPKSNPSSSESQPKRVVLFKPPVNSSLLKLGEDDDDDDDDEEEEIRRRKASQSSFQTPSVTSFLSSIPAPKHSATLGVISSSGSGRRSILETDVPVSSSDDSKVVSDSGSTQKVDHGAESYDSYANYSSGVEQNVASHRENYDNAAIYKFGTEQNAWNYASYDSYGNYHYSIDQNVVGEAQSVSSASNAGDYGSYENYDNYGDHIQYGSDLSGQPAMLDAENAVRIPEKRRRNEIPSEILEVKQDELIKNRPRQDQVKLTGIAFGPSYQPASSTKGKPSKLHKRKHQITSLYYDMKQKEMELAERRARGLLTKAETQAKYGW